MAKTSWFALMAALALTIAACGGDDSVADADDPLSSAEPDSTSSSTSLALESAEETAPDPSVPTTALSDEDTDSSEVSTSPDESLTSTTLAPPKPGLPAASVPVEATTAVDAAVADLSARLGVDHSEILVISAGFGSAPADNPCEPPVLDRRGEETPLVSIIDVVLRHGGVDYRYVEADGRLHACETIAGK